MYQLIKLHEFQCMWWTVRRSQTTPLRYKNGQNEAKVDTFVSDAIPIHLCHTNHTTRLELSLSPSSPVSSNTLSPVQASRAERRWVSGFPASYWVRPTELALNQFGLCTGRLGTIFKTRDVFINYFDVIPSWKWNIIHIIRL